jgi:uncharacterized hydrophobic protein (TIGR00271 family)
MSLEKRVYEARSSLGRKLFGVWGVQDYYTRLEQIAEDGAQMTYGYILMVLASAAMATGGLLINSPAIVIGSMCVAPFLGPSRAVCIGGLFCNRKFFLGGLPKQFLGLLILGSGMAYIITVLLKYGLPGVEVTHEILLRSMANTLHVVLSVFIAVSAGIAASLALSAEPRTMDAPWGEVIDAVIGVEIAISLIPPASVIGISLALGRLDIGWHAFLLLMVNILGLDIFGSMLMLGLHGVKVRYLAMETTIRRTVESTLAATLGAIPLVNTISVTLIDPTAVKVHATVRHQAGETHLAALAQAIGDEINNRLGYRSEVMVETIPCQRYSTL